MRRFIAFNILIYLMSTFVLSDVDLKRVGQWRHDEVVGYHFYSLIDVDYEVIGAFFKCPVSLISSDKIIKFARQGQGPNELTNSFAGFFHGEDLAIVEMMNKIKIFTKKNGTYVWKETKWLKAAPNFHFIKNGLFFDNKFFLTGVEKLDRTKTNMKVSLLKVYDESGKPLKQLVKKTFKTFERYYMMNYYVNGYKKDRVFFLPENELKVSVVSSNALEVVKEVNLEVPPFYKKMPEDFYTYKKYDNSGNSFQLDLETWAMGYSRVNSCIVEGDYLVLQMRTCSDKLKKFALLFYNAGTFKLEHTLFIDDFLLGARDGKYYFFANGDPSRDEDTDECIINIYTLEKKEPK